MATNPLGKEKTKLCYASAAALAEACYNRMHGQSNTCSAKRNDGARSEPRYEAGAGRSAVGSHLGLSLSVVPDNLAGNARLSIAPAQEGNIRAWLLLARTWL